MSLLFAHDTNFIKYDDKFYNTGNFSIEVFRRYTKEFGEMTVVSRQRELDSKNELPDKLSLSSGENIKFVKVPNINSVNILFDYSEAYKIIEEQVLSSDYVIARLPSIIGSIAVKIARKHNKKYLTEVVGCSWDAFLNVGGISGKISAPILFALQRYQIKYSPYVVYITKKFLQSRYPTNGRSEIIPNVKIDSVDRNVLLNRIEKIQKFNTPLKFGLIGSLDVDYKGHKVVLDALSLIKDDIPDFKIEFLGKGNSNRWNDYIQKLGLENNVVFKGTLSSGDAVFDWLDRIDVQLQPSKAEAQGRSIIEGMSRGCPIIASNVGGIIELIDDKYLTRPNNSKELANLILKILNFDELKKEAVKNFNEAKEYYSVNIENKRSKFYNEFKRR